MGLKAAATTDIRGLKLVAAVLKLKTAGAGTLRLRLNAGAAGVAGTQELRTAPAAVADT